MYNNQPKSNPKDCYKDPRGFIYLKIKNKDNCDSLDILQLDYYINSVIQLCDNSKIPILVDTQNVEGVISSNHFIYFSKHQDLIKHTSKIAFLVNSLPLKILMFNYIRIYKPSIPCDIFSSQENALSYCL